MKQILTILSIAVTFPLTSVPIYAEAIGENDAIAEFIIGEETYKKVYVSKFEEQTGKVILRHSWGIKRVKLEDLTKEQINELGIETTLSKKEVAFNRSKSEQQRLSFIKQENEKLKQVQQQKKMNAPTTTTTSSNGALVTTSIKNGIKTTITKKRVG